MGTGKGESRRKGAVKAEGALIRHSDRPETDDEGGETYVAS